MLPSKQSRLTSFFGDKGKSPDDQPAPKRQKLNEEEYKEARLTEGLPYVGNGNRDKFGNPRFRVGGRPKKLPSQRAGVAGGASSNRKKCEMKGGGSFQRQKL